MPDEISLTDEEIYELAPFAKFLGVTFDHLSTESVRARLVFRPELSTMGGAMHGGALIGLADLSIAVCTGLNMPPGSRMTTAESTTYFLRPMRGTTALSNARPIRVGKSVIYAEADIHDEEGNHCVRTSQVVSVLPPK